MIPTLLASPLMRIVPLGALLAAVALAPIRPAIAAPPEPGSKKVVICHWSEESGSYVRLEVAAAAATGGHGHHGHARDLIPAPGGVCPTTSARPDLSAHAIQVNPESPIAGQRIEYRVAIANTGSADATGIAARVTLPTGVTFVRAASSVGFSCTLTPPSTLACSGAALPRGHGGDILILVDAPTTGTFPRPLPISAMVDPNNAIAESNESNNSVSVTSTVQPASLAELMPQVNAYFISGGALRYDIDVRNDGGTNTTGVVLQVTLPAGVTFLSANTWAGYPYGRFSSCSQSVPGTVTCTGGAIPIGSSGAVTITVQPTTAGVLTLTTTVDPNNAIVESNEANNTVVTTTTVTTGTTVAAR